MSWKKMVRINKIYTRTGDKGTTALVGGSIIEKDHPRVEAYGSVDELNSWIGVCSTEANSLNISQLPDYLSRVSQDLFDIGAELATPSDARWEGMIIVNDKSISVLESWIDNLMEGIPPLTSFVLPGGSSLNASLHVARTVCRRAEREVIRFSKTSEINDHIVIYLNRLSDLLFAMCRYVSIKTNTPELLWKPGGGTRDCL